MIDALMFIFPTLTFSSFYIFSLCEELLICLRAWPNQGEHLPVDVH